LIIDFPLPAGRSLLF